MTRLILFSGHLCSRQVDYELLVLRGYGILPGYNSYLASYVEVACIMWPRRILTPVKEGGRASGFRFRAQG